MRSLPSTVSPARTAGFGQFRPFDITVQIVDNQHRQLEAGFAIEEFYKDEQPNPRFMVYRFMPIFRANRALKS